MKLFFGEIQEFVSINQISNQFIKKHSKNLSIVNFSKVKRRSYYDS